MKQRVAYIDSAKALLIALVVLGHVLQYANPNYNILPYTLAQAFICSFHMPAFFLLTGMLSDAEKWKCRSFAELLKSRVRTLVIPYFFFESLAVVYKHFVLHTVSLSHGLYLMLTLRCNVGADWYLPALFLASLIYWLYVRCPGKYKWIPALLVAFAIPPFLPDGHAFALLFRGLLGFGFIAVGALLKERFAQTSTLKCAAAFLLTAVSAAISFKFGLGNDFYNCYLKCSPLFLLGGVSGLYFVLGIAKLISCKPLAYIGENTLVIMGTHQLVLYTIAASSSLVWVCVALALIAVIEIVVIFTTNRFCPRLIGKKKG